MPSPKRNRNRSGNPAGRPARTQQSARTQQLRLAQQQAERRRQRLILSAVVVGIVIVVVAVAIGVQAWRAGRQPKAPTAQPSFGAVRITDGKPIVLGRDDADVTVELFEDFRCPHCADFEETLGSTITDLQRDGTIKVELYPMSFVDPEHGSVSAANAMACAATEGRGQQYYAGLFQNYPLEWTNERLIKLGELVGLTSADFRTCITAQQHRSWVDSITKAAADRDVNETPTVFINGELQDAAYKWKPDQLKAAVRAAS